MPAPFPAPRQRELSSEITLSEREALVLQAVISHYVMTAEPTGSRTLARMFDLGVSPATIRNTMHDLEEKGMLFHPHTSAGRIPTDRAYRLYVDRLMQARALSREEIRQLKERLEGTATRSERFIGRAVQALSVLTRELGVALAPTLDEARLERLDLLPVVSDRVLLVLTVRSAQVKTIFVDLSREMSPEALREVATFLNERLAGLTLREIRETFARRVADSPAGQEDLLNIFVQSAERLFASDPGGEHVVLGTMSGLTEQPEFASGTSLRTLLTLTEERARLAQALAARDPGLRITIGMENAIPSLTDFSLVTADYRIGSLRGTIGVMGPTRMPYEKVIAVVQYTSQLLSEFFEEGGGDA
ncbi:MAG: heat-inducible transcription repressor HrcA [Gemmatimonadetes bacterium]|nr:heat-inducible transcription repressor HrcA [Gemmatimonadota bacterium]